MPSVSIRIPQMGEGLREARLVAVLKQPGDKVKRDEPIYQMETDKAVMDVESPFEGTLIQWHANVDDILLIGSEVGTMQVAEGVEDIISSHDPLSSEPPLQLEINYQTNKASEQTIRRLDIPPRTRAHAKSLGITNDQLNEITAMGSKLLPEDIDLWIKNSENAQNSYSQTDEYHDQPLSSKQKILNSRLTRGNQIVVPGTISVACKWSAIETLCHKIKNLETDFKPSAFTIFAYAVTKALENHPTFRSTLINDNALRTYHHIQLGIAVSLPEDQLVIAVVEDADKLSWRDFAEQMKQQIELARTGKDQVNESVALSITNMRSYGILHGIPVVVPPSIATLFIGSTYKGIASDANELKLEPLVNIVMTFDHRISNGAAAAQFIKEIKNNTENIEKLIQI